MPTCFPDALIVARRNLLCDAVAPSGELDFGPMKSEVFSSAPQHEIEPFGVRSQDDFAMQHDCVRLNRHAATPSWETQFQKTI
jgi:hypothetical protein